MKMTPRYFYTTPTSCAILPCNYTPQNSLHAHWLSYWHQLNECTTTHQQGILHCSHSTAFCARHCLVRRTHHSHNTTHSPCTSTCATHPALPTPLPSTTYAHNKYKSWFAKWHKMYGSYESIVVSFPFCLCYLFPRRNRAVARGGRKLVISDARGIATWWCNHMNCHWGP